MAESGTAPSSRITLKQRAYDAWFRHTHQSRLIYNTCWEDPRADRAMLRLDSASEIAMITSAGCNALDYLLDDPAAIHCVDMNPRQNALLDTSQQVISQRLAAVRPSVDPSQCFVKIRTHHCGHHQSVVATCTQTGVHRISILQDIDHQHIGVLPQ